MAREIERKFLVASNTWRGAVSHRIELRDGIIALHQGRKVRVRFYGESHVTLCVKGPRSGASRDEFEYPIPRQDGLVLIRNHCDGGPIRKTRHFVPHEGQTWTVDEYHDTLAGTIIAELELASEDAGFARPAWIGAEVTHDRNYRQTALFRRHLAALADGV